MTVEADTTTTTAHERANDRWHEMTRQWNGGRIPPGRNDLPECLADLYGAGEFCDRDGRLDGHLLAAAIEDTWSAAEYPEAMLDDHDLWVEMFHRAAMTLPDEPVTLYRGVREAFTATHMSWTATLDAARWFADRYGERTGGGLVYVLRDVDPDHVLAQLVHGRGEDGRSEDEYVLDPFYLDDAPIELYEDRRQVMATDAVTTDTAAADDDR